MMRFRRVLGFVMTVLLLASLVSPAAGATEQLDQSQGLQEGFQYCKASYDCAQVFTAGLNGGISRVRLQVDRGAGSGDMVVEIRNLSGGQPTGTPLGSAVVAASAVPASGSPNWIDVPFSPEPEVVAGQQYALYVSAQGTGEYHWYDSRIDPYSGGLEWLQDGLGVWGPFASCDFAFETYVIPLPNNAWLSGLTLSQGALSPTFSSTVYGYSTNLSNSVSSVVVTPTTDDPAASATVNGNPPTTPVALAAGLNNIAVVVTAPDGVTTRTYTIAATRNTLPTITGLSDQTIPEDGSTGSIPFTIGDAETDVAVLTVAATSLTESIVPVSNITLGGTGANRTIRVTPSPDANGIATIAVQVSDGTDVKNQEFTVTVTPVNDPPTVGSIANQSVPEDSPAIIPFTVGDPDGALSTLQITAQSSDQAVVPDGNITVGGSGSDRTLTITPVAQSGTTTIAVTVSDGTESVSTSFDLTLITVNDAPIISALANRTIPEDSPSFSFSFTISDEETAAADLSINVLSSDPSLVPAPGTVTNQGGNVTVTMNPVADANGAATITVEVSDGEKTTAASFILTVSPSNDPPVIGPVADQTTQEDVVLGPINVTVSDVDSPVADLLLSATSSNQTLVPNASILLGGSDGIRTFTITPAKDQSGTATITLWLNDGLSQTTRSFTLTVTPVNDPPAVTDLPDLAVAQGDPISPLTFTISDPETGAGSLTVSVSSSNQALVPDSNLKLSGTGSSRTLSITPATSQVGSATITIQVSDGQLITIESFVLTISQRPTISPLSDVITDEDSSVGPIAFTVDDLETPADLLIVTGTSSNQVLVPNANMLFGGSGSSRTMIITPATNQYGVASITVTVNDGTLTTSRSFVLTVNSINDPPTISAIADLSTQEDAVAGPIPFTVGDAETAPGSLILSVSSNNQTVVPDGNIVLGGSGANRNVSVVPANQQSGTATVTITVFDGEITVSESFVLTVINVDDPPQIFAPSNPSVTEDSTASFEVSATDVDSPLGNITLSVISLDQTKLPNGNIGVAAIDTAKWSVTVTPAPNASGTVTLRLSASDGNSSFSRDILLTIIEINDPPTISAIANQTTDEDVPITGIGFTITDIETPADQLQVSASTDNPTLFPSSSFLFGGSGNNRTLTLTPAEDRYGTAAAIFITVDDGKDRIVRSFLVTVNPVPDPPKLKGISDQTIKEDEQLQLPVVVYDPDSALSTISIAISSNNQTLVPDSAIQLTGSGANRTLVITPTAEWSGGALITVVLSGEGLTYEQSFTLTVEPVNDEPIISLIQDQNILEGGVTGTLGFTVGDIETPAAGLTVTATSSSQTIVPNANILIGGSGPTRTIQVAPAPDQFGTVTITVNVSDGDATAKRTFKVIIEGVNDVPSFTVGPDVTVDEDAGPQSVTTWATNISAGPFEQSQTLSFLVSVDNPSLFSVAPQVSSTGALTYTTALHANGVATLSIRLRDNGGTANGGVDLSSPQSVTITVNPVNDLPEISGIPNQGTEEGLATERLLFTVSDVEMVPAMITVTATSSNQDLVPNENIALGGLNGDRWVQVTPAPGRIGTTTITLRASDGEGFTEITFPLIVNNLKLSALVPSVGEFSPPFSAHTLSYTAVYIGTVTEVMVTPASMDPNVEILVNGTPVTSGLASPPLPLTVNGGDVEVVVRAPATGLSKTYKVRFVRAPSKVTDLADLAISPGTLNPPFDPAVTSYQATVDPTVSEVAVVARPADGRAKVTVEGNTALQSGVNQVQVRVTAENGEQKLYTINLVREAPPLGFMGSVEVEPGSEWTTLRFRTNDPASVTVYYQTATGKQLTLAAPARTAHTINLGPLSPGTTYTYSVVATRGDGSTAHHTSFFTTADPTSGNVCQGGEIRTDAPLTVAVRCPSDAQTASVASLALPAAPAPGELSATLVTQVMMSEALKQMGVKGLTDQPTTVVVYTQPSGKVQSVVIESGAVFRALQMGASLEVRSSLGGLTLPPNALASLMTESRGRLVILFEEVPADRADVAPWVSGNPFQKVSPVVDVSVATVYDDGRVEHHDRFPVPVRLTLNIDQVGPINPDLLGAFWLTEGPAGTVTDRVYAGGKMNLTDGSVSVERTHLSTYVALRFTGEFRDVPGTYWAHGIIWQMAARQVIRWPANDLFEPEVPVTRGDFATMLVRALRLDSDARFAYVYSDIQRGDPLAGEIGGAIMSGLMMGYPDGTFHPEARITRQELAVVLYRISTRYHLSKNDDETSGSLRLAGLQDWEAVAPWAKDAVRAAVAQGLMTGRTKEAFTPGGISTRAEAATVVKRLLDWIEGSRHP